MAIAVIGSRALSLHFPPGRKCKDLDIVGSYNNVISYIKSCMIPPYELYPINGGEKVVGRCIHNDGVEEIIEAEIAWSGSSAEWLYNMIQSDPNSKALNGAYYASLNVLYMLKMSHRFLKNSPAFLKTMRDIRNMEEAGAFIEPAHQDFYEHRCKKTYSYAHPSLKRNKSEFFSGDGVKYVYDHDTIHESMKIKERPAYTYFKDDDKEVWCSKDKFFACSEDIRLNAVIEESLVLALERSQIPFPNVSPRKSFLKALEKVCTSITSGWFREYAWKNYDLALMKYDLIEATRGSYVKKFWEDVKLGIVKQNIGS